MEPVQLGTVKWFSRVKGYGFITPDGQEKDIFVHFSGVVGQGYRNLEEGQRVQFEVEQSDKGPQCINVSVVADEPPAARYQDPEGLRDP
ncbi:MAG: cold-shock protein [Chloroflexi bacterium]|nr:cold-shock protein [Chloroflexota bacterium]